VSDNVISKADQVENKLNNKGEVVSEQKRNDTIKPESKDDKGV